MNEMQQPVTVSAFRPGDWFGIVGPAVSVFLPPSEKARVGALWEIVDGGADFDEVLDTLIASGLRSLPGFLLLGGTGPDTRVVARGPARAVFALASGEQVTVDGADARTWNERSLDDVSRVSVLLEEDAGEPGDRSVDAGLVRVARIDRPPFVAAPEVDSAPPVVGPEAIGGTSPAPSAVAPGGMALPGGMDLPGVPDAPEPYGAAEGFADESSAPDVEESLTADADADHDLEGTVIDPTPDEETTVEEGSADVPSWPAPAETAPPFGAPTEQTGDDLPETPSWSAPSALDAPSVPGWPAPAPLAADAPEPSLEPPLSVGSWKRDGDADTDVPGAEAPDAETEVFDVAEIAAAGEVAADPETPAPWPAPAVGGQASSEMPVWDAPAPVETPEHDGQTVSGGWDAGEFARQQPGIPGQPQAPEVTAQPVATLVFAHGEVVAVDRAVLIGRAPEARRFTSTEQPRLVTVPSPNQEISSTHLEVRPGSGADHGSAVVTDMGSTNGTVVVQPGLGPESLTPGTPVQLLPGALIDLGDGMTIQVAGA